MSLLCYGELSCFFLSEKDNEYIVKDNDCVVWGNFLLFLIFFQSNLIVIWICKIKILICNFRIADGLLNFFNVKTYIKQNIWADLLKKYE